MRSTSLWSVRPSHTKGGGCGLPVLSALEWASRVGRGIWGGVRLRRFLFKLCASPVWRAHWGGFWRRVLGEGKSF